MNLFTLKEILCRTNDNDKKKEKEMSVPTVTAIYYSCIDCVLGFLFLSFPVDNCNP